MEAKEWHGQGTCLEGGLGRCSGSMSWGECGCSAGLGAGAMVR